MQHREAETIGRELIRALRGRLTRAAFSKRLGYRSNVVHRWETGEAWPPVPTLLSGLARMGRIDRHLFAHFLGRPGAGRGFTPPQVARFLRELQGKTPITTLAAQTGYNRFQIARWLRGQTRPRLPEFLCLVEATSRRLLDLLALIIDPARVPSVAPRWEQLQAAREAAYQAPWSHAVLRALELGAPAGSLSDAELGTAVGLDVGTARDGLEWLVRSGQVRREAGRYRPQKVQVVDTRADPDRSRDLKAYWGQLAIERLQSGRSEGDFGYSLFAIHRDDLERLRTLHLEYVRAMQSVIAHSTKPDCVGLYCAQLLDLRDVAKP